MPENPVILQDIFIQLVSLPELDRLAQLDLLCKRSQLTAEQRNKIEKWLRQYDENELAGLNATHNTVGQSFGKYRIIKQLGKGGMGTVYLAEDTRLERMVALKFATNTNLFSTQHERFIREGKAAARLRHPNICTVYDAGEIDDKAFIAMEYINGDSLKGILEKHKSISISRSIEIAEQIAEGLAHAHDNGIIHRDIKPANILLTEKGQVKIVDFGIAHVEDETSLTLEHQQPGTLLYMSPEQLRGMPINCQTDIWSLGVVLSEMISGEKPFRTRSSIIDDKHNPIDFARWNKKGYALNRIIDKCLQRDLQNRITHISSLAADLKKINHAAQKTRLLFYSSAVVSFILILLYVGLNLQKTSQSAVALADEPEEKARILFVGDSENSGGENSVLPDIMDALEDIVDGDVAMSFIENNFVNKGGNDNVHTRETIKRIGEEDDADFVIWQDRLSDTENIIQIELVNQLEQFEYFHRRMKGLQWQSFSLDRYDSIDAFSDDLLRTSLFLVSIVLADDFYSEEAKTYLNVVVEAFPDSYSVLPEELVYFHRGSLTAMYLDNDTEAISDLTKVIQLDSTYDKAYGNLGLAYAGLDSIEQAIVNYDTAIRLNPKRAHVYVDRAEALVSKELYDEALSDLNKAISLDDDEASYYKKRADFYSNRELYRDAIADYSTAIELSPNYVFAFIRRGDAQDNLGSYDEALDDYNRAIELDPTSTYAYFSRGIFYEFNGSLKEAIADYTTVLSLDSTYTPAYVGRGEIRESQGLYKDAVADFTKIIRFGGRSIENYGRRADALMSQGLYEEAIVDISRALQLDSSNIYIYEALAEAYFELGLFDEVYRVFSEALRQDSSSAELHFYVGESLLLLGNFEDALTTFDKAIALSDLDSRDLYYSGRGYALAGLGRYEEAKEEYYKDIRSDSTFAFPHFGLGRIFHEQGRYREAILEFTEAILRDATVDSFYTSRGNSYKELGRIRLAGNDFSSARKLKK